MVADGIMRLLGLSVLASVLWTAQDPGPRMRELLERMREGDIAETEEASAELVKLGTEALPVLREEAQRQEGDLKMRIDAVIRKIERAEKVRKVMGTPAAVSLKAKDRPVGEILAELSRQS